MKRFTWLLLPVVILLFISGCGAVKITSPPASSANAVRLPLKVIATYPHDAQAFTEGLFFADEHLYESIGLWGHSAVRKVELKTGKVLLEHRLPGDVFGEGLAQLQDKIVQLTWQKERAYVYEPEGFKSAGTMKYEGEGWGLTSDGKSWINSNGSDTLTWRDAQTFTSERTLQVTWNGKPVENLNELEWIDGVIWANVWHANWILQIDPESGKVLSYLDVSSLVPKNADPENVPNGIAYDSKDKRIFITGKRWPVLYEIALHE